MLFRSLVVSICLLIPNNLIAGQLSLTPASNFCETPESILVVVDLNSPTWYPAVVQAVVNRYNKLLGYKFFNLRASRLNDHEIINWMIVIDTIPYDFERQHPERQGVVTNTLFSGHGCILGAKISLSNRYQLQHRDTLTIVLTAVLGQISGLNLTF